jgi:uncharacterized protein (TIGR03067 family)
MAILLGLAVLSLGADESKDVAKEKDLAPLQGMWTLEGIEANGAVRELPEKPLRWVIKGNTVYYGGEELAVLTVDPATTPPSVDLGFLSPKRSYEGVYVVEKDTLKICFNKQTDGVKERPLDFTTEDKPDRRLFVFKRVTAKDVDPNEGLTGYVGMMIRKGPEDKGVVVADVFEGSPGQKAGLKKDDFILKINDMEATDLRSVIDMVRRVKPGNELMIRVRRGDKEQDIKVKAGVLPFYFLE